MRMRARGVTIVTAAITVGLGVFLFLYLDILRPQNMELSFDGRTQGIGPIEALNGAAFPSSRGQLILTEPFAHLSLPLQRTLLGKRLYMTARFHLDEADVFEVGVKQSAFWLDYERRPLEHRVLETLATRDDQAWTVLRSGPRVVYLNSRFTNPWTTVDDFERRPPTDGPIGLYGNAKLPHSDTRLAPRSASEVGHPTPDTRPFRLNDNPETFRAIYAFYPAPAHPTSEWTENDFTFDLSRAHQNDDGSIDIMFFAQRRGGGSLRILLDHLSLRIEPGWPHIRDAYHLVRNNMARLLKRPRLSS